MNTLDLAAARKAAEAFRAKRRADILHLYQTCAIATVTGDLPASRTKKGRYYRDIPKFAAVYLALHVGFTRDEIADALFPGCHRTTGHHYEHIAREALLITATINAILQAQEAKADL